MFAINALAGQMGVSAVSFRNLVIVISVVAACAGAVVHAHAATARPPEMAVVADAYAAALEAIPTMTTPLLDASALPADRACEAKEPKTFAILIGAVDTHADFGHITGAPNDVRLLTEVLARRSGTSAKIIQLMGADASRAGVQSAFLSVLDEINCGDRVFFHFSGHGGPGWYFTFAGHSAIDRALAALRYARNLTDEKTEQLAVVRQIYETGLFLFMNRPDRTHFEVVSSDDVSRFVTAVRNRKADAIVAFDTHYSNQAGIAALQAAAGDEAWSIQAEGGTAPVLVRSRGDFLAIYGSVDRSPSRDKVFLDQNEVATPYGEFTYLLAGAIGDESTVTARDLAQTTLARRDPASEQNYRFESSNPTMRLFDGPAGADAGETAITILSPALTRGPQVVKSTSLEVVGRIDWPTPVAGVFVHGERAVLEGDGETFRALVPLKVGLNTIKVEATTKQQEPLSKSFDVNFDGDLETLKGVGRRYALIIGNANYDAATGFARLVNPINDADAIEALLTSRFGFTTTIPVGQDGTASLSLRDAPMDQIDKAFDLLSAATRPDDEVLIFYAGHGSLNADKSDATWVPIDAGVNAKSKFMPAAYIAYLIGYIEARKVIVISDSCYSGLLRAGGEVSAPLLEEQRINQLLVLSKPKSRLLISSGNDKPVVDGGAAGHSIFAQALLDGLASIPDDQFPARELFTNYIQPQVAGSYDQDPQFSSLEDVGHVGGDMIFIRTPG